MRNFWLTLLMLPGMSVSTETVISRCTQEDGTIAFQETPCVEPADDSDGDSQSESEEPAPADGFSDFVNPFDEHEVASACNNAVR
jgi:hypothetical protein